MLKGKVRSKINFSENLIVWSYAYNLSVGSLKKFIVDVHFSHDSKILFSILINGNTTSQFSRNVASMDKPHLLLPTSSNILLNIIYPISSSSSASSFIFKTREMSKSIQIKAGTTRQKTALTVALGIHINTSIEHYSSKAKHTIYEKHKQQK